NNAVASLLYPLLRPCREAGAGCRDLTARGVLTMLPSDRRGPMPRDLSRGPSLTLWICMNIVVVESPAKAKTINKYLGPSYEVLASFGHVRDLPAKNGSVDPDAN